MDVHGGQRLFDGAQEVAVKESVEVAGQAALNADFRCAAIPGFAGATNDFVEGKRVGIGCLRSAAKAAKTASDEADRSTDGLRAQIIRYRYQSFEISAFGGCQAHALFEGKLLVLQNGLKRVARARRALSERPREGFLRHGFVAHEWGLILL